MMKIMLALLCIIVWLCTIPKIRISSNFKVVIYIKYQYFQQFSTIYQDISPKSIDFTINDRQKKVTLNWKTIEYFQN